MLPDKQHGNDVLRGEWLIQSAGCQMGRMVIRLAKRDGIKRINIVRRREPVAELKQLGADAVIVSAEADPRGDLIAQYLDPDRTWTLTDGADSAQLWP